MPAAYLKAPGFTGAPALRICMKAGYDCRRQAMTALKIHRVAGGGGLRVYKCPVCPETWHIGHPREKHIDAMVREARKLQSVPRAG